MAIMTRITGAPAIALGMALAGQARGQDGQQPGDIVVTAQRRAETTQKVSLAITAVDNKELKAAGINSIQDVSIVTPSFVPGTQVTYGQPYIRGVGSALLSLGTESSVALYVDGIYQSRNLALLSNVANVDRIEVLAGPQGALYGRNATGGAINILTREPTTGFSGNVEFGYGNYDGITANAYVSGGNDTIAANASGYINRHSGYTLNLATGDHVEKARDYSFSSKVLIHLSSKTSIEFAGDALHSGPDMGTYLVPLYNPLNFYAATVPGAHYSFTPHKIFTDEENSLHNVVNSYGGSARLKSEFSAFDLNVIGSYRYLHGKSSVDADGSDAHLFFLIRGQILPTITVLRRT